MQSWQLVGLEPAEEQATAESALTLTTTNGDPQMILEDVSGQVVRTLSYTVTFDGDAREMCLYYTTKVGEDYSQDRRVFPQNLGNGQYLYTLPRTSIAALRLDPCSPDENKTVDLTFAPATLTPAKRPGAADMQSAHIAVLDIAANKLYNKGYGAQAPYWRQDPP